VCISNSYEKSGKVSNVSFAISAFILSNNSWCSVVHFHFTFAEGRSYRVRLAQVAQILAQNHAPKIGATVWKTLAPKIGATGHYDRRCLKSLRDLGGKVETTLTDAM
jgi:hypothetical protein